MAPPTLTPKHQTHQLRRELVFTDARVAAMPLTSSMDNPFPELIGRADVIIKTEQDIRDKIERLLALLVHYDVVLDGFIDIIEPQVRSDAGGDRKAASYQLYFTKPPHVIKRPGADVQAPTMDNWPQLLASSPNQVLSDLAPRVAETIAQVGGTVKEIGELHTQLETMAATGEKKQLVDAANAARHSLHGKLHEMVHARSELHLGNDFPASFFRRAQRWNAKVVTLQSLEEQIEAVEANLEKLHDLRNQLVAQAQLEESARELAERKVAKAQLAESMKSLEQLQQQVAELRLKAGEQ